MATSPPPPSNCITYSFVLLCVTACRLTNSSVLQWILDYPDLDYPDPRLSESRTEIIARAYNNLCMRVVAVDKKIIVYMAANVN